MMWWTGTALDGPVYWLAGSRPVHSPRLIAPTLPYAPPRYQPVRCAACDRCWHDSKTGRCIYGGPFLPSREKPMVA